MRLPNRPRFIHAYTALLLVGIAWHITIRQPLLLAWP